MAKQTNEISHVELLAKLSAEPIEPKTWFVAQTGFETERRAEADLQALGYDAYVPRETTLGKRRPDGRRLRVSRPLFYGYLFVAIDAERQSFAEVLEVDGIERLLQRAGTTRPAQLQLRFVEALRLAEQAGVFDRTRDVEAALEFCQKVRIVDGPFGGHLAQVVRASSRGTRVRILFEFLNRMVEVDIPVDRLERAA